MNSSFKALAAWIDARSLRERVMVMFVALAIVYVLWDALVLAPVVAERARLLSATQEISRELQALTDGIRGMLEQSRRDPNADAQARRDNLRVRLAELNGKLRALTDQLVPPERMPALLKDVLSREGKLELVRLQSLGATPVAGDPAPGKSAAEPESPPQDDMLFRHGLRLDFRGTYFDTLRYFERVEALPWQVLWESAVYRVEEYPQASVSITVYSLSIDDAWIGV